MADIFFDLETKELLDQHAPDQDAAIRALHFSVGVSWCECHDEQIFRGTAALAEHLLRHDRIIGFRSLYFDNTVLAWSPERILRESFDPVTGKHIVEKPLPDAPEDLKKTLDLKTFDVSVDLEQRVGHKIALASLAEATLGKAKNATGPQAVVWNRLAAALRDRWPYALMDVGDTEGAQRVNELGRWFQERLEQYCAADVQLLRRLYEYGIANRRVAYIDFEGERRVVKVHWRSHNA
jgi:hypothetical protein